MSGWAPVLGNAARERRGNEWRNARLRALGVVLACALAACGSSGNVVASSTTEATASSATASSNEAEPEAPTRCKPSPGTSGSPQTILQVVDLINGLPRPVTIPCLLESLERPLVLNSTVNVVSAQPAEGYRSPRMFVLLGPLSLSFVPEGDNRELLELGEQTPDALRSVKAEIHFPIEETLEYVTVFERLLNSNAAAGTKCGICHFPETAVTSYAFDGAFESPAYRPNPQYEVNFEYVKYQYEQCDAEAEPERCHLYVALFGGGEVVRGEFPAQMLTFN